MNFLTSMSIFSPDQEKELIELIEKCDNIVIDKEGIDSYLQAFDWEKLWDEFHSHRRKAISQ